MQQKRTTITEVYREAGDDAIYGMDDPETGVKVIGTWKMSGPFALNWRGIFRGVVMLTAILLLLPLVFRAIERLYEFSLRLPATWQPYLGGCWLALTVIFVIGMFVLHPLHLISFIIGVLAELIHRTHDWQRRRRDKRDPRHFETAYRAVAEQIGCTVDDDEEASTVAEHAGDTQGRA